MKNRMIYFMAYGVFLSFSLYIGYFLIVFSVFYFLGRQDGKTYNGLIVIPILIVSYLTVIFFIFHSIRKIIKMIKNW